MTAYDVRKTSVVVLPAGEPLFSERATTVSIVDEAAGEFVEVAQYGRDGGKISIDPDEWPALRAAIDSMIEQCSLIAVLSVSNPVLDVAAEQEAQNGDEPEDHDLPK